VFGVCQVGWAFYFSVAGNCWIFGGSSQSVLSGGWEKRERRVGGAGQGPKAVEYFAAVPQRNMQKDRFSQPECPLMLWLRWPNIAVLKCGSSFSRDSRGDLCAKVICALVEHHAHQNEEHSVVVRDKLKVWL
jgi:hypothetical protein